MAALNNVYHNFPRLAKQSGFNFQLHRGRVNWSEIERLDIGEITEKGNFELLEQNLVNVTNCNLDKEYDLKILDQNFVKLFKLAQLGVDYLSYCEMYLDKCVVLLQEQLIASQDECELLKKEIQKRKEVSRSKSKNKTINYQCEKCAKVFISDVYLKFHEKRRHSSRNTPESFDGSPQKCSCNCQNNEDNTKLSKSTQTLFPDEVVTITPEKDDISNIKTEHMLKMEKLEQELQELKERFKKAEKTEPPLFHSINVPNTMHYNPMVMLLPSYLTHLTSGYPDIHSGGQIPVPEVCQPVPGAGSLEKANKKPSREDMSEIVNESTVLAEKKYEEKAVTNFPDVGEDFQNLPDELECEKENLDPKIKTHVSANITKPLPPPRKLKKAIREQPESDITAITEVDANAEKKAQDLIVVSTPVKKKLEEETNIETFEGSIENISEITKPKTNSTESLQSRKSVLFEPESKSFFKRIVTRESQSKQKLGTNFRKSLNSLCDSVSSAKRENTKKEANSRRVRTAVVDRLNNHLQHLGISSEWTGIPRKTMKQKLSAWKHQSRLLTKENSLYPVIRRNIEEKVIQKLKKNFRRKKPTSKLNKQEPLTLTGPEIQDMLFENQSEFVKSRNCLMYDTDTDSESDSVCYHENEENNSQKPVIVEEISSSEERIDTKDEKEPDLLLFQAGRSSFSDVIEKTKQKSVISQDKLFTDSDTESSFLENFARPTFKKCLESELITTNDEVKKLSCGDKPEAETQSILKDGEGFQSKPVINTQKKVLFAMYAKGVEEELSDDPTEVDLWSLKSDWEKNAG